MQHQPIAKREIYANRVVFRKFTFLVFELFQLFPEMFRSWKIASKPKSATLNISLIKSPA